MNKNRDNIYLLLKLLGYMDVDSNGIITHWKWDYQLNKPIKIKN